ncbi:MAG TPA: helix-turn-helix transcriptional regulator [Longimicrobium sp.]|nr:helix-turn-helix transcriptional regulator [Longimicrobium sp.]
MKHREEELEYEAGSGNIFADLGWPDADEALARAELMRQITTVIRDRKLSQACAAKLLDTNQPTVSDLVRGRMSKFSLSRLIAFMNALGYDVEIVVRERPAESDRRARLTVAA